MNTDILEEFDNYISSNKEILNVLPVNTKKNRSIYVKKVEELEENALQVKKDIWNEIVSRYEKVVNVEENPEISKLNKNLELVPDVELFNELNTPFERLGFDKIIHDLGSFFESDLELVNKTINEFILKMKSYGITITVEDFTYSSYAHEYMEIFFEEVADGNFTSEKLKKGFETIYWKCPEMVTHIALNLRYLYNINANKISSILEQENSKTLRSMSLDKNALVRKFFELNKDIIKLEKIDKKLILDRFTSDEWKVKDFSNKQITAIYDRLYTKSYFNVSEETRNEVDENLSKLLNTLQEYRVYARYKYIIDDLKKKYKNKDKFKNSYEKKLKELKKKEQELLKENKKNTQLAKSIKNPLLRFLKKKMERKLYEAPAAMTTKIKEIKELYESVDEEAVNKRIIEFADDNCTLKYMFKIATSFYTYAFRLVKEHYKDDPEIDVEEELKVLIDFINQPYKVMLNNIKLIEEPDIVSIISKRYKILNIDIDEEDLNEENIEELISDVERVVDFYNIRKSGLEMKDIEFLDTVKPMMKNNK